MSDQLLLVVLGPVQEYIAQARRTRDLWFGSHALSEISRAAAGRLIEEGATLVFPAIGAGDVELDPCDSPLRQVAGKERPPLNVANKILAQVPAGRDPARLAERCREAAGERWRALATQARERVAELIADGTDRAWDEQIDTLIEFAAAWTAVGERGYKAARLEVEAAVAQRKLLRDFSPWRRQRDGVPKSSLDGARNTLLQPPGRRPAHLVRRFRLTDNEQLDAIGLTKRAGGEPSQFVPVTNVAVADWLAAAARQAAGPLDRLRSECRARGIGPIHRPDLSWLGGFPFDAQVLFEERWPSLLEEVEADEDPAAWGGRHVRPLLKAMGGAPSPYVSCLVADGDQMGAAIDTLGDPDDHRRFSIKLAEFAGKAREIVEQRHRGLLVYSGGDDVLAFVCLGDAISCAGALRQAFGDCMEEALADEAVARPTLSVGLAVGHSRESMSDLLQMGRQAESLAKGAELWRAGKDRNALAIVLKKRSGGELSWRRRWSDPDEPSARLAADIATWRNPAVSHRKVYEVRSILDRMPAAEQLGADKEQAAWAKVLRGEVARSLARSESGTGQDGDTRQPAPGLSDCGIEAAGPGSYAALHARVDEWVSRMLITRLFHDSRRTIPDPEEAK